ncbi:DUF4250 domain-containing protein [Vibrio ezurae]|uniref:DUF4250 domain-containing protein n=1 Tax=Vibrio ezurae NBRC 102218 TaxID=1219080 RepID=U3AM93_9VIBR|nr:DUF4250 domain-containing protein [Vibrio ezurae]GAD81061.1 hypothetical protein VEZ01S_49_00190 [Vibrio ezurae NBRC 102218]
MNLSNFAAMDPVMLMSIVNMKLRDDFNGNLDELAKTYDIDKDSLITKLASAGFDWLDEAKQFR